MTRIEQYKTEALCFDANWASGQKLGLLVSRVADLESQVVGGFSVESEWDSYEH